MLNITKYYCGICNTKQDQISHHKSHLTTEKHKDKKELFLLKLKELTNDELIEKYNTIDINNIIDNIETIIVKNKSVGTLSARTCHNMYNYYIKRSIHIQDNFVLEHFFGFDLRRLSRVIWQFTFC